MSAKEELELEALKVFDDHSHLFDLIKFPRIKFLEWLESFDTLTEMRAANHHVIHKMLVPLQNMQFVWKSHAKTTWQNMRNLLASHSDVVKLRNMEFLVREQWQNRPKAKRKY